MRNSFNKIFLVSAGLLLGITLTEVISGIYIRNAKLNEKLRYIRDRNDPNIGTYDQDLGWGFQPNSKGRVVTSEFDVEYSINSGGLRDKESSLKKPEGQFRILALGGSNVFGQGINYGSRFTEIIEKAFNNVEVINMGVWDFGMDQSLLQLQRDGFKHSPDLVVLFILIDEYNKRCMDFYRMGQLKPRFVLSPEKKELMLQDINLIRNKFSQEIASYKKNTQDLTQKGSSKEANLIKKSKLYTLLNYRTIKNEINYELRQKDKQAWSTIYKDLSVGEGNRSEYAEEDFKKLIFLLLKNYREVCRVNKTDLIVVCDHRNQNWSYLIDFCNDLGIACLDLTETLRHASNFQRLRFEIDPHYNEFTHKVIGEYLSDYLSKKYKLEKNSNYHCQFLGKF